MHQIISTDHLEQIFHAVHDNVIFGPAQALHIDSHNLGPDTAQEKIITVVLWRALVGPHSLGLPGVDLTHGHLSEMCQGASLLPIQPPYTWQSGSHIMICHQGKQGVWTPDTRMIYLIHNDFEITFCSGLHVSFTESPVINGPKSLLRQWYQDRGLGMNTPCNIFHSYELSTPRRSCKPCWVE